MLIRHSEQHLGEFEEPTQVDPTNTRASMLHQTADFQTKPELEISRVLPPMPKLKNYSHLVNTSSSSTLETSTANSNQTNRPAIQR